MDMALKLWDWVQLGAPLAQVGLVSRHTLPEPRLSRLQDFLTDSSA